MTAILDTPVMTYVGGYLNREPQGAGTILNSGNYLYSGKFNNGFAEGFGKLQLPNGYAYEGELLAGRFHGIGKLRMKNKNWTGRFLRNEFVQGQFIQRIYKTQDRTESCNGSVNQKNDTL